MRDIGGKLVIATHNPGKLREISELVAPLGIECVSAKDLDLPEPEEIGNSFADNADLKAREAADLSGLPALADDSGLCVDALQGRPSLSRFGGNPYSCKRAFKEVGKTLNVGPSVKFAFHLSSLQCVQECVTLCIGSTACNSRHLFISHPEFTDRTNPHAPIGTGKIFAF